MVGVRLIFYFTHEPIYPILPFLSIASGSPIGEPHSRKASQDKHCVVTKPHKALAKLSRKATPLSWSIAFLWCRHPVHVEIQVALGPFEPPKASGQFSPQVVRA